MQQMFDKMGNIETNETNQKLKPNNNKLHPNTLLDASLYTSQENAQQEFANQNSLNPNFTYANYNYNAYIESLKADPSQKFNYFQHLFMLSKEVALNFNSDAFSQSVLLSSSSKEATSPSASLSSTSARNAFTPVRPGAS